MNRRHLLAAGMMLVVAACSTRATRRPVPRTALTDRQIRVALPAAAARIGATTDFRWFLGDGTTFIARARRGEQWFVEYAAATRRVRAIRPDGQATAWQTSLVSRPADEGFVTLNGKRYRGELAVLAGDSALTIVNRLGIEDYLRGVVAAELGSRPRSDSAAVQAQAVASRTYAYVRALEHDGTFDVRATTADQVYGGVDVENDIANDAIDVTRGLVLRYGGRIADAPYHSTCGGSTAAPAEVWGSGGSSAPYLRSVSDRIERSDRYYCDIAPRYRWTREFSIAQLNAAVEQYLRAYASVPGGRPGAVRAIGVGSRTPSGRVGTLDLETERGIFALRGNDIRYVLRTPGGEILASTYFSVEPDYRRGTLSRVTLRGQGFGHGIGMCQWGAIGRARAGQSFRTILSTYYPGTSVGSVQ